MNSPTPMRIQACLTIEIHHVANRACRWQACTCARTLQAGEQGS